MPWYNWLLSEKMKKSICAYLIQRYLGQFFEEKLTSDQLSVDLYNGTGSVEKIILDVQALNELSEKQNWPLEFVDGFIEKLQITIPWTTILKDSSFVEVNGLKITVQPKQRNEYATSMFESMWNSMTSSLKLAEEYARQESNKENNEAPYEGVELFAKTIDSVLSKVEVKFINTTVQIEHVPKNSHTGVGIIIKIDLIEYSDEAGKDPSTELDEEIAIKKDYVVQTFSTKNFQIDGVTLSTIEFPSEARTFSRSMMSENEENSEHFKERDESDTQRNVVIFGKFAKKQVIKVHMKQSEDITAPKVSIEVNLNHLVLFLSPRQLHLLIELGSGLASPDLEDHSNVPQKSRCIEKPMTAFDYQIVENELQQQMRPPLLSTAGLQAIHGWSGAPLDDDSENDENFLPMRNSASEMYDSAMSGLSSGSMESSLSSSAPSTVFSDHTSRNHRKTNHRNYHHRTIEIDPTAEISHFRVQLTSLSMILLHEDLLNSNSDGTNLTPSSVEQMQRTSREFFEKFENLDLDCEDFEKISQNFCESCKFNHLRLISIPVHLEAKEKTTTRSFSINGTLDVSKLELVECLYGDSLETVVIFKLDDPATFTSPFCVTFKHTERTVKSFRNNCGPKTDISFNLGKCSVEFDVTIVDRITALLQVQPICTIERRNNTWTSREPEVALVDTQDSLIDIKLKTTCLNLKIRFPIPDFRPSHDLNKPPWWKRHIRPDHLILKISDATFETLLHSSQNHSRYSFRCRNADIFYNETDRQGAVSPLHVAKVGLDGQSIDDLLNYPKIHLKIFPETKHLDDIEQQEDLMTQSTFSPSFLIKDNGPFTSKKVSHHSNTPHDKQPYDEEELIIPGDKEEIDEFMRTTIESARIHLDIILSNVELQLNSKHVYELIYNRIINDLLLWQPGAPKIKNRNENFENVPHVVAPMEPHDIFSACKSGVQYESESDSEEISEEGDGAILFYSTYDRPKPSINSGQTSQITSSSTKTNRRQSLFVMNLQINSGSLLCNTPVRDARTGNVIPGHVGDLQLNVECATIFLVNGYKGDEDLGYVAVQVGRAELNHCEMTPSNGRKVSFSDEKETRQHLHATIYKSDKGVLTEIQKDNSVRDMLTVACKIESKHETHNVKTIRVALGLNRATLRHRTCSEPNTWISQLLDFFNVNDYPIPGYVAKEVLTELHIYMWDCAIDYRPLYLPLRSMITLGCFSMTSHLSEKSDTSTLRFIAEECGLFISEKHPPKNGIASNVAVNLKRDYVNVISLGLFELSLRITDKNSKSHPHIDMRASNDCVHIYTCSDSGRALTQLITYIATDGDLKIENNTDSAYSSPQHQPNDQELINVEQEQQQQVQDISKLTKSQHQQVNEMLGEALQEPEVERQEPEETSYIEDYGSGTKLFFFPDENQSIPTDKLKPLPQVVRELGDFMSSENKDSDSDDDFCFVDKETGLGLFPKNGIPEIKWLTNDPVRVIENHFFVPVGKKDLLKAPDNFPTPKFKYTLCEMNLIWHMYGGNDFSKKTDEKNVEFSDTVTFSNNEQITFSKCNKDDGTKRKTTSSWKIMGGVNRNQQILMELELNKVKFQHEIYPDNTFHASRQILLISELEIRDVLASSEFNKFLYQYTSEAKPKQSQGHMIAIKAVHIRPDKNLTSKECCLRLSLLPLRFNIDQDSLKFLVKFFSELGQNDGSENENTTVVTSKQNTPTHHPPIMTINVDDEKDVDNADSVDNDNLILLDACHFEEKPLESDEKRTVDHENQPVFFRNVVFGPDVPIKIDYQGKHIEVADGSFASLLIGLVMGLGQLNCSELRLKRISYRHGLLGVDKLLAFLLQEWLNDIKKNQLPSLLSGVGPIYSLVQLFQGIKDLFWMPIEQYQKDGRIVRGIQRGANSFTTSTAMAALELTSRLIHLIQLTAETAYDMLSPGPSFRRTTRPKGRKKRYKQPQDIREGVANAYCLLKEGLGETVGTIVRVASHEHEQKGYSGAVGGVLRQIPPTIIKPIIIGTEATNNLLGGMKYQLIPDARNEANQKWRSKDE